MNKKIIAHQTKSYDSPDNKINKTAKFEINEKSKKQKQKLY